MNQSYFGALDERAFSKIPVFKSLKMNWISCQFDRLFDENSFEYYEYKWSKMQFHGYRVVPEGIDSITVTRLDTNASMTFFSHPELGELQNNDSSQAPLFTEKDVDRKIPLRFTPAPDSFA